jgi:hypothetical protein
VTPSSTSTPRSTAAPASALAAAAALARAHGLPVGDPEVLLDGSNLLVHFRPASVVVRVATFTASIRSDPLPWLQREVALASHLAGVGAAVVPPADEVPPGPHLVDGWWMTAWRHVPHDPTVVLPARELLPALDALHAALAGFSGELPAYGPVTADLDLVLDFSAAHGVLSIAEVAARRARRDELLAAVSALPLQPQHGDAHPRNVLATAGGPVWNDFEDCCWGSPLWDLATLARRDETGEVAAVARTRFGEVAFDAMLALRDLQGTTWGALHTARAAGRL